jgi:hypothetical protein
METEVFNNSLRLNLLSLINVDDLPFLVSTSVSLVESNISVFFIFVTLNIKDSVVTDVRDEFSFKNEELPPPGVGAPDLQVA